MVGDGGTQMSGSEASATIGIPERKQRLAKQLQMSVAQGGRVESQGDTEAVLVFGKPVNHTLHAIISIFSCGLWLLVWLIIAVTGGEKRQMITVDEWGNVAVQRL